MAADDQRDRTSSTRVPRHEVQPLDQRITPVVLPSLWECWPNVAREALLLNRPILATPVGGLTELVQPGPQRLARRDTSAEAIADADRPRRRDRRRARPADRSRRPARPCSRSSSNPDRLRERYVELVGSRAAAAAARPGAQPLVSVVVPYFRLDDLVEETLASVRAQTHSRHELIVVNDGSLRDADDAGSSSSPTATTRTSSPSRTRGSARRATSASRSAAGEYVLPLDADDLLAPTFIERCVGALEATTTSPTSRPTRSSSSRTGRLGDELRGYTPYGNWTRIIERLNAAGSCSALPAAAAVRPRLPLLDRPDELRGLVPVPRAAPPPAVRGGGAGAAVPLPRAAPSMLREMGAPLVERYAGELRAYLARGRGRAGRPTTRPR